MQVAISTNGGGLIPSGTLNAIVPGAVASGAGYAFLVQSTGFNLPGGPFVEGGTITGEHGVGIEKINSMCVQFSVAEREAFFSVKRAFDPVSLLNPNKAIPTLVRCAEYGKMHVRPGQLKFAELPRF